MILFGAVVRSGCGVVQTAGSALSPIRIPSLCLLPRIAPWNHLPPLPLAQAPPSLVHPPSLPKRRTRHQALLLPISDLVSLCRARGILTLVDGAHGLGATALSLAASPEGDVDGWAGGADYYVGNCHKWFSAPRGVGFLRVNRAALAAAAPPQVARTAFRDCGAATWRARVLGTCVRVTLRRVPAGRATPAAGAGAMLRAGAPADATRDGVCAGALLRRVGGGGVALAGDASLRRRIPPRPDTAPALLPVTLTRPAPQAEAPPAAAAAPAVVCSEKACERVARPAAPTCAAPAAPRGPAQPAQPPPVQTRPLHSRHVQP